MYNDTIAAISTPVGEGGIGIVRISGADAKGLAQKVFPHPLTNRRLAYGHIVDPVTGETIDEVLVSFMASPHTYTMEDTVEINCHGGPLPTQRIMELFLKLGARLANPGEFTLRAFLNGRIDLAQAESVLDVIRARTSAGLRLAVNGLGGDLSQSIKSIRSQLVDVLAYLTARIDFPDDEVPNQDINTPLMDALKKLDELIAGADRGIVYRQGVRTAIVGRRNVGKSSLMNRLLGHDRAIVSQVPGTTRDTLEEVANIKGIPFILIDTAGMAGHKGVVESLGIARTRTAIETADLVLLVIDISTPLRKTDREIIANLSEHEDKTVLVAQNKCDKPQRAVLDGLPWPMACVSALTGDGIEALERAMANLVLGGKAVTSDVLLVSNPRHRSCLQRARDSLEQALESIARQVPDDFVTIDLTASLNALGEITGETVSDQLLENIFSNFCIGK